MIPINTLPPTTPMDTGRKQNLKSQCGRKRLGLRIRTLGLESPSCVVSRFTFFTCQTEVLHQLILEAPSSSDILWSRIFRRTSSGLGDFSIMLLLLTKYIKHLDSCWAVRSWDAGSLPTVESNFQRCICIKHSNAQKLGKGVVCNLWANRMNFHAVKGPSCAMVATQRKIFFGP